MFFDFLHIKKEETVLLIDIGNGSVGGAFVLFRSGHLPKILYALRLPISVSEKTNASKLLDNITILLGKLLGILVKTGFTVSSVFISFSSPWVFLKTKHITVSQNKSFVITKAFILDIVEKEEKVFQKELSKDSPIGYLGQFYTIEKSIVHTKINGYSINDSIDKKTKTFDAFLCLSVVEKTFSDKVDDIILKHTHIGKEKILMHSFPLISFSVIRDIFSDSSDFIIMDITSEVTDMTLVKDNIITQTVSFPFGRNFIIRQIAKGFSVSNEIAESMLHIYSRNKTDSFTSSRIQEVLKDILQEWSIYFEDTFLALSTEGLLPKKVYITADSDIAFIAIEFLKLEIMDSTADFRKNLDITYIDYKILSNFYESDPKVFKDEFIDILAVFYNKFCLHKS